MNDHPNLTPEEWATAWYIRFVPYNEGNASADYYAFREKVIADIGKQAYERDYLMILREMHKKRSGIGDAKPEGL